MGILIKPNQSLLDVIIQETGSLEAGMAWACYNGWSITGVPEPGKGDNLETPVAGNTVDSAGDPELIGLTAALTDSGTLQYFVQNAVVPGTLGTPPPVPPPLSFRVVLYPVMKLLFNVAIPPATLGRWDYNFESTAGFVCVYGLMASYPAVTLLVNYETVTDVIAGGVASSIAAASTGAMTDMSIHYKVPYSARALPDVFVSSDLGFSFPTVAFEDVHGNVALTAPAILLDAGSQAVKEYWVAGLLVEYIGGDGTSATLRVTRSHPPSVGTWLEAGHGTLTMNWVFVHPPLATGEYGPDPGDPTNPDKLFLYLPSGSYTLGVQTDYFSIDNSVALPSSKVSLVFEIY